VTEAKNSVLKAKKPSLFSGFGMSLFILLFLGKLGTFSQNLSSMRGVEHWEKHDFAQEGMMKSTNKRHFLTIKATYEK
jgi:hypothetical protein